MTASRRYSRSGHFRVTFGGLAGLAIFFAMLSATAEVAQPRIADLPNVVLILADDAGVETVGAYGGEYRTPRIDDLARQGIRFENAHATPLCTPSRVRLLTGRYSFRNYKAFGQLHPRETTIGNLLKQAGYRTAAVGKWQLGGNPIDGVAGATPAQAGFDEWRLWATGRDFMADGCQHWGPTLDTNGLRRTYPGEFGSDLVQRFALDFIDRNKRQPFFLFYSAILPHDPWVSTPAQPRANTREEKFAAMIEYLDSQVGEILDRLDHHGIASRTLVIFVADNGTHPALRSRRNGLAVQGGKGSTLDAGTHVPLIVRWPERIPAPSVRAQMVDLTDIFATLAMAAGARQAAEGSDGLDLLASSAAAMPSPRASIYMDYGLGWWPLNPIRYAFDSRWKLYGDGKFFETAVDPLEKSLVSPDSNSSEAAAARAALEARISAMGEHAMTAQDPYFPRGFDPEAVDFGSITRRLAERNVQCGDPARVGS